eukprot:6489139-Amphidinium_carterae.1
MLFSKGGSPALKARRSHAPMPDVNLPLEDFLMVPGSVSLLAIAFTSFCPIFVRSNIVPSTFNFPSRATSKLSLSASNNMADAGPFAAAQGLRDRSILCPCATRAAATLYSDV